MELRAKMEEGEGVVPFVFLSNLEEDVAYAFEKLLIDIFSAFAFSF